jgi:hypothetical protein
LFSHLSDIDNLYDDPCKCLDIRYVLERLASLFRDLQYGVNYVCGGGFDVLAIGGGGTTGIPWATIVIHEACNPTV